VIHNPKKFFLGAVLMVGFLVVLVLMFLPLYGGMNLLDYMDSLYNSISKGSAYYIAELKEQVSEYEKSPISFALPHAEGSRASEIASLLGGAGAAVSAADGKLRVDGDLGAILARCLDDADQMYSNDGSAIRQRYGYDERRALYDWWTVTQALDKELKRKKRFADAAFVHKVEAKAVECAYNYYEVAPYRVVDKIWLIVVSLLFYVVYTIWYGFAIILLFEGWGLRLSH
jgi:hypothetical protein